MIRAFQAIDGQLREIATDEPAMAEALWIDLEAPSGAELARIGEWLGIDLPSREDMEEIEPSSRVSHAEGIVYLTAQILASRDMKHYEIGPVTFILLPERLVTLHYHHPIALDHFTTSLAARGTDCTSATAVFLALMEMEVDRLADSLESEGRWQEKLSRSIFDRSHPERQEERLSVVLGRIGRAEDSNSKVIESLATLLRVLRFLTASGLPAVQQAFSGVAATRLAAMEEDLKALREVAEAQSSKIRFQLDATLGVINMRQADIVKIFSVVAFVFLPPTLIASIYGMNFRVMPELDWRWGYPAALVAMLVSALVPCLLFRLKRWL